MLILFATDLHLTARPEDEYRFQVFQRLLENVRAVRPDMIAILGDVLDRKDNHPSLLINKVVDHFAALADAMGKYDAPVNTLTPPPRVLVLKGNHDYIDPDTPFLRFMNHIDGVQFVWNPCCVTFYERNARGETTRTVIDCLPHSRNPREDWASVSLAASNLVLCHQTFAGCDMGNGVLAEDGVTLEDLTELGLPSETKVISGDIHVPQRMYDRRLTYVGSPHHVSFGTVFDPRLGLWASGPGGGKFTSIPLEHAVRRVVLNVRDVQEVAAAVDAGAVRDGDHAKVALTLPAASLHEWEERKEAINDYLEDAGVRVASVELVVEQESDDALPEEAPQDNEPVKLLEQFSAQRATEEVVAAAGRAFLLKALSK